MVDAVPALLLQVGPDGAILRANRLARERLGVVDRLAELGPGEPWDTVHRLYDMVLSTGVDDFMEVADPDSEEVWELTVNRIVTEDAVSSAIVVVRDIGERLRLEKKLRRLDRLSALGGLVHGISHNVRSNLFGVTGLIDVLRAAVGDDPKVASYLDMQRRQTQRIVVLVDRVMEYGGPIRPHLTSTALEILLPAALAEARAQTPAQRVQVHLNIAPKLPPLHADRERLSIAFTHLIKNALQHSPPEGSIHVRAWIEEGKDLPRLHVEIIDQGPGITPEHRRRIFEPFFTESSERHGLGLPIAQRIVEDHDGFLSIHQAPSGGCRAHVALPVHRMPQREETP